MGFHLVTIAMMSGAGAERIGRLAAEQLGFQYVNDEVIYPEEVTREIESNAAVTPEALEQRYPGLVRVVTVR